MKQPEIPNDRTDINDKVSICCRRDFLKGSCTVHYFINNYPYYQHNINADILFKFYACQLILNKHVNSKEIEKVFGTCSQIIDNWVEDYIQFGLKTHYPPQKKTTLFPWEANLIQRILKIGISFNELKEIFLIDFKLIQNTFDEGRIFELKKKTPLKQKPRELKKREVDYCQEISQKEQISYKKSINSQKKKVEKIFF